MYAKRYALVFAISLLVANAYTFWPAIAYSNTPTECPAIFGQLSYNVIGATQVLGPPLYSEMQVRMTPGTTAYETATYTSQNNNLTQIFQGDHFSSNPTMQYLSEISPFGGSSEQVTANASGVLITFQNITYSGIHVANIIYKISISTSASYASYEIGEAPCWTGLILTVGPIPYMGPLAFGAVQEVGIIVNNVIALVAATIISVVLRFYWASKRRLNPK